MAAKPAKPPEVERRVGGPAPFSLMGLPAELVVEGVKVPNGLMAPDPFPADSLREQCPYCRVGPLKLVLRKDHVIRSHLFCEICTRCFDVVSPDGHSALAQPVAPIY